MRKHTILLLVLIFNLGIVNSTFGSITVGRVGHVEGEIYRYMADEQNWVETFVDSPAGTLDVLSTGKDSRAEITFPNDVMVRLDDNTEIEIRTMEAGAGEIILHTGLARFLNRSSANRLEVETDMGTVKVGPASAVDVQVDGNAVVVSAVHGEATFQSVTNGVEKLEVISGSTSLKFYEDLIIAGTGPIDRKWDRWCAEREKVRAYNRLVRSEYLPETMQEYAYVLKSNGRWRRVYYQGYYYRAWQPRYVASGWSPYSSGFWYSWQGGPVWIDHNSWGWVTHHHGHWIHINRAWMWTPYIHVSSVPGVAVAGLNIAYGRAFRPNWHPGRVRWISHSSYIGWLPLAPWETYYGYRSWGPGSVAVKGGVNFSISINLAQHRHVSHAVIIPKHHLHQRGKPVIVKNYSTVKVGNINNAVIIKSYRAVPAALEQRGRKHKEKAARARKSENRNVQRSGRRTTEKYGSVDQAQKREHNERTVYRSRRTITKEVEGTIEKRRIAGEEKTQKKNLRPEQRISGRKIGNLEKKAHQRNIAARDKTQRSKDIRARSLFRSEETRQAVVQAGDKTNASSKNIIVRARQSSMKNRKQTGKPTRVSPRQVQQNEVRAKRKNKEKNREYDEDEKRVARVLSLQQQKSFQESHGNRRRKGKDFASTSFGRRSFR